MQSFKVTGTPGEAVWLDTLEVGDWYIRILEKGPYCTLYPSVVTELQASGYVTAAAFNAVLRHIDPANSLVYPLTRHELADGTVEFRHVGAEAKDDIRPIGDLPEKTEFEVLDAMPGRAFVGPRKNSGSNLIKTFRDNGTFCGYMEEDREVRVIAYPSDKMPTAGEAIVELVKDLCPSCNGTGVKPEPTYLERLPEAVRECIFSAVGWADNGRSEALARTIFENAEAIALASKGGAE